MPNGLGGEFYHCKKILLRKTDIFFFSPLSEWNSTPGPETGEYFTRWQRQCEGMHDEQTMHRNK